MWISAPDVLWYVVQIWLVATGHNDVRETSAVGCIFEAKPTKADAKVTYTRDVAPILYANCVSCHRPGEVAPFSLMSYEDAARRPELIASVTKASIR